MDNKMTLQQALDLLDQVARQYRGTRDDHLALEEARRVLQGLIDTQKPEQ